MVQYMKNPVFYILLLSGLLMTACAETSTDNDGGDYINPGFTEKDISPDKGYLFTDGTININGSGSSCQAVAFQGDVANKEYVGLAVKNGSFNIKIYWRGSSFPANVNLAADEYIIKITNSSGTSSTKTDNLNLTRSSTLTGVYKYTFNETLQVTGDAGTFNIAINDYIAGYAY